MLILGMNDQVTAGGAQPHLTDLRMWYDASDSSTITVSGSPSRISKITNKASGYTLDLVQNTSGSQPEYVTAYQNGLNAIKINGSVRNDFLSATSASPLNGATAITVFVACITNSTANGYKFHFGASNLYANPLLYQLNSKNYYESGSGTSALSSTSNFNGVANIQMVKHTGTSVTMITSTGTDETNTATGGGNLAVGNTITGIGRTNENTDVHIFECLAYNGILDATATATTKDYLKTKWNI